MRASAPRMTPRRMMTRHGPSRKLSSTGPQSEIRTYIVAIMMKAIIHRKSDSRSKLGIVVVVVVVVVEIDTVDVFQGSDVGRYTCNP
jgi:hypothetical protein